jgi:hypothetical protein
MSPEQNLISFVVMQNVFAAGEAAPPKLNQVYDLKGSTVHRASLKKGQTIDTFKGTLKDMDLSRKFRIGSQQTASLLTQLQEDVTFFSRINIMDYSLLVGIHDCTTSCVHEAASESETDSSSSPSLGGLRGIGESPNSTAFYYFGIIDILQLYNLQKKVEHHFKSKVLCMDAHGISAVNSQEFAARFLERIKELFE